MAEDKKKPLYSAYNPSNLNLLTEHAKEERSVVLKTVWTLVFLCIVLLLIGYAFHISQLIEFVVESSVLLPFFPFVVLFPIKRASSLARKRSITKEDLPSSLRGLITTPLKFYDHPWRSKRTGFRYIDRLVERLNYLESCAADLHQLEILRWYYAENGSFLDRWATRDVYKTLAKEFGGCSKEADALEEKIEWIFQGKIDPAIRDLRDVILAKQQERDTIRSDSDSDKAKRSNFQNEILGYEKDIDELNKWPQEREKFLADISPPAPKPLTEDERYQFYIDLVSTELGDNPLAGKASSTTSNELIRKHIESELGEVLKNTNARSRAAKAMDYGLLQRFETVIKHHLKGLEQYGIHAETYEQAREQYLKRHPPQRPSPLQEKSEAEKLKDFQDARTHRLHLLEEDIRIDPTNRKVHEQYAHDAIADLYEKMFKRKYTGTAEPPNPSPDNQQTPPGPKTGKPPKASSSAPSAPPDNRRKADTSRQPSPETTALPNASRPKS